MTALTNKEIKVLNAFNAYFTRYGKPAFYLADIYGKQVPWGTPVQVGYVWSELEGEMLNAGVQVQRGWQSDYSDALVDLQKRGLIELLPVDLFDNVYRMTKEGAEVLKGLK